MTGVGRVCGVSDSSAPRVTTGPDVQLAHDAEQLARRTLRQRMFGSMPRTSTRSNSAPGGRQTDSRVVGQLIRRVTPSTSETVGRLTWKS